MSLARSPVWGLWPPRWLLWPAPGRAQTAPPPQPNTQQTAAATNPDADLFLPSLQGYRNNRRALSCAVIQ
ncbi:MAG: hypothetical protein WBE14_09320 [Xanthobacteraceae bacterium]